MASLQDFEITNRPQGQGGSAVMRNLLLVLLALAAAVVLVLAALGSNGDATQYQSEEPGEWFEITFATDFTRLEDNPTYATFMCRVGGVHSDVAIAATGKRQVLDCVTDAVWEEIVAGGVSG